MAIGNPLKTSEGNRKQEEKRRQNGRFELCFDYVLQTNESAFSQHNASSVQVTEDLLYFKFIQAQGIARKEWTLQVTNRQVTFWDCCPIHSNSLDASLNKFWIQCNFVKENAAHPWRETATQALYANNAQLRMRAKSHHQTLLKR